ncbi:hypothetical protein J2S74_005160 [Evansella vedderi]|uniref:DUF2489 domain-containing protein n=1 Tax=Evansella vedderi TaxID=38282 RepID=A0ABU0A2I1_9BACI|nr:hypothetical protein [Evansella vedderi]MDQ0257698.1 hypothetical protein [Evansella vedderi]
MEVIILGGIGVILLFQFIIILFVLNVRNNILKHNNKSNNRSSKLDRQYWKNEVRRTVELQCMMVRNAIQKQIVDIHMKEIQIAPRSLSIPYKTLEEIYTTEQLEIIVEFWQSYNEYLNKYWLTSSQNIKSTFPQQQVSQLVASSKQLTYQMNQWIEKIMDETEKNS